MSNYRSLDDIADAQMKQGSPRSHQEQDNELDSLRLRVGQLEARLANLEAGLKALKGDST